MAQDAEAAGLTVEGCRRRQERLRAYLREEGLEAALLIAPPHVHYFTGHWARPLLAAAVLIRADGPSVLITANPATDDTVAGQRLVFPASRLATLVDDQHEQLLQTLRPQLEGLHRLGVDQLPRPGLPEDVTGVDILPALLALRRTKDADEVALLRRAVAAAEAGYDRARQIIQPGLTEIELYAQVQEAAVRAAGEPISDFGNDFQAGASGGGGPPRQRPMRAGELLPLDLTVGIRSYHSDLSRTFCVGGQPNHAQREAHRIIVETLQLIEAIIRPGLRCKELYDEVHERIDGRNGWRFPHHLGHGIGLFPHEAPRLNPHWNDIFQVGDVFTCEPGLYGPDLAGGVRLEQDYLLTRDGVERLSQFPLEL